MNQIISAVNEVDVGIVVVRPSMRPCVHNFEVVAAVGEMRPASENGDVPDGEMVVVAKMRAEVFVINAAPCFCVLLVVLFLPRLIVMLVVVLGISGHRPT